MQIWSRMTDGTKRRGPGFSELRSKYPGRPGTVGRATGDPQDPQTSAPVALQSSVLLAAPLSALVADEPVSRKRYGEGPGSTGERRDTWKETPTAGAQGKAWLNCDPAGCVQFTFRVVAAGSVF